MLQLEERAESGFQIISAVGRIDSENLAIWESALNAQLDKGLYQIILDMSGVGYINSAGLRTLTTILNECQKHEGGLYLIGLSDKIHEVFEIIGLHSFFHLYQDLETCLDAIG